MMITCFREFCGQDLQSRGATCLEHRARDGATVTGLRSYTVDCTLKDGQLHWLYHHGNDLLCVIQDTGEGIAVFANVLDEFRPTASYPTKSIRQREACDPIFGDDTDANLPA